MLNLGSTSQLGRQFFYACALTRVCLLSHGALSAPHVKLEPPAWQSYIVTTKFFVSETRDVLGMQISGPTKTFLVKHLFLVAVA